MRKIKIAYLPVFQVILLFILAIILLRSAWLCDDAYISLRTVDNFVNGFGLTWNVAERVQAFTHPLWVLLITPFYAITSEVYFTVMIISIVLSLAVVSFFAFKIARTTSTAILGLLALSLSTAFIDFSTSGLENPLTFLIMALFLYIYFKRKHDLRTLRLLSLIASLGAVNRLDTILLFLPMLVYVFWSNRGGKAIVVTLIGFTPLISWELFSLIYYGFPFPNTAYAKLSTGLGQIEVWQQGLQYIIYSLRTDPVTVIVILSGIIFPFVVRQRRLMMPAIAVFLYLLYIINIGGCFMAGRYLAAPLLTAVVLLSQYRKIPAVLLVLWAGLILVTGLTSQDSPVYASNDDKGNYDNIRHGVVQERDWYIPTHGLMNILTSDKTPQHHWIEEGLQARRDGLTYLPHAAVGMVGFYAGPQVYILDIYAITDPLLARLPMNPYLSYRIGHFGRLVPAGYKRSIVTGENHINNPSLSEYYDKLVLLTRGDIFGLTRFIEIAKFNLGWYDHLIDKYNSPHLIQVNLEDISEPRHEGVIGIYTNNFFFHPQGIEVILDRVCHAPKFEFSRHPNNGLRVEFILAGEQLASGVIPDPAGRPGTFLTTVVTIPENIIERGYDKIKFTPAGNSGGYNSIGHLRLID